MRAASSASRSSRAASSASRWARASSSASRSRRAASSAASRELIASSTASARSSKAIEKDSVATAGGSISGAVADSTSGRTSDASASSVGTLAACSLGRLGSSTANAIAGVPCAEFPFAVRTADRPPSAATEQTGQSRMAGEHSLPHSGQIQYSIYINSRPKAVRYLSVSYPTFIDHGPYVAK